MEEKSTACRLLVEKPEGKRLPGRPRRRWVDHIKMDLVDIGWDIMDWIGLAEDRYSWGDLVNAVMTLRVQEMASRVALRST
jgi:hypothetical protein